MVWRLLILVAVFALAGCAGSGPRLIQVPVVRADGSTVTLFGQVTTPEEEIANGYAVCLFGGGLGFDLDWTVPGSVAGSDGAVEMLTIDGRPTRDAAVLREALVNAGFVVMRYGSLVGDGDLGGVDVLPFVETIEAARAAYDVLGDASGVPVSRTFAIGHSLGAPRAVLATDGAAGAYVFLAGAYLSNVTANPSELAMLAVLRDVSGARDIDGDRAVRGWETAAALVARGEMREAYEGPAVAESAAGARELLLETEAPVLAVWGGLDATSVHGPLLQDRLGSRVKSVYEPRLGHNLGEVSEGRTGPMAEKVVALVTEWLVDQAGGPVGP